MTRREFERAHKRTMGRGLASDERAHYRISMARETFGCPSVAATAAPTDYLAERARYMAHLRSGRWSWEPELATLGYGARFRAAQAWRASRGLPLLEGRSVG
jgi:hypothetical protein